MAGPGITQDCRLRRSHAIAAIVALAAAGALVAAAFAYDRARNDTIAPGVRVGGVEVGGLDRQVARAKLERELLNPLREPIVLSRATRSWRLTAREARISADVEGSVDAAVERSREGNFLARAVRGIAGSELSVDVQPRTTYDDHAIVRLLDRVRRAIEREPREASVDFTATSVEPVPSAAGLRVPATGLHRRIRAAIVSPTAKRTFTVHMRKVRPKVTTGELAKKYPTLVMVDRGGFRLRLYKNLRLVKTYPIAVGQAGLETPAGLYSIQDKQVNPTWNVPKSDWAGDLAGKSIPPGPDNPIKARWMGLFAGAGIHGTEAINSLGTAASHGCVRMAIPDVIELFERVEIGTPVYVS